MTITEEQIEKLKTDNPEAELHLLEASIGEDVYEFVIKTSPAEYDRWRDTRDAADDVRAKKLADRNFVNACRAWPSAEEWAATVKAKPGLASTFAGELAEIHGLLRSTRRKKL